MSSALVIGGTGFVGRHTIVELIDHGYDVTTVSRGRHERLVPDRLVSDHIVGDRTDDTVLTDIARSVEPDIVIDCAAFHPRAVRTAADVFAGVEAYVYVSSGAVYSVQDIPKREDETPLHDCTPEQATDESMTSYGPRKAEGEREVAAAADRGVPAMSVRPTVVYGPRTTRLSNEVPADDAPSWAVDRPGIQAHHDYWVDRVNRYDRVIVPGDGTAIWHRAYVEDVATAIRLVAERGESGAAYNVGDRTVCTLEDIIELIAGALGTSAEVVHTSRRELAQVGLAPDDFILYHHAMRNYPHVLDTCKLASLGWEATPRAVAMERTVEESVASGRDGQAHDPGREVEERLLAVLGE